MKDLILAIGLILVCFGILVAPVSAAKKRVWKTTTKTTIVARTGFGVSAKLTGWKQYLDVNFKGVAETDGVTYELTYNSNNNEQGVYGNVKTSEGNVSRSIFLGTCSHGSCVSHTNISNVRLTITYKTKDGQNLIKKYKVKY